MTTAELQPEPAMQRHAWIVLLVLGIMHAISGLYVLIADDDTLAGLGFTGFAVLGTAITFWPFRRGERWSWYTLWAFPAVLGLTAGIMYSQKVTGVGSFYAGSAVLAVLGLLLPIRKFFPQPPA
ncbi:MAG: hypothetical protein CL878_08820 [Dehalococcoidia bacterium]|nr:hypothetical protein [Dehalococcoidia bacterium]